MLFSIFNSFFNIFKSSKTTDKTRSLASDSSLLAKRTSVERSQRRRRLEFKERRQNRHRLLWAIIRHFVDSYSLSKVDNIYDFKKCWNRLSDCVKILQSQSPTENDIKVAYRVIKIKYTQRKCEIYPEESIPDLSQINVYEILNPDKEDFLLGMYDRMRIYWDEVLSSYKSKSARHKRLEYLIDRLSNEEKDPFICDYPSVIVKIDMLKDHYKRM